MFSPQSPHLEGSEAGRSYPHIVFFFLGGEWEAQASNDGKSV